VITGALIGAAALSLTLGPVLYETEGASRLAVYGGTAVVGGLVGALIGRIVFEARRDGMRTREQPTK
jgi:hypothetical protein